MIALPLPFDRHGALKKSGQRNFLTNCFEYRKSLNEWKNVDDE